MYKKIAENTLACSIATVVSFLGIPLFIFLLFKLAEYYNPEDISIFSVQTGRLCVLLHIMLLFIWMYHLGKSLLDISSRTSKQTIFRYEVRNLIFLGLLAILLIYRIYMMFTKVWVINGDGDYAYIFFARLDLFVLLICFIMHFLNANTSAKMVSRIIRPRMRFIYLAALVFYPIGIFYMQPKFNKIKTRKAKKD